MAMTASPAAIKARSASDFRGGVRGSNLGASWGIGVVSLGGWLSPEGVEGEPERGVHRQRSDALANGQGRHHPVLDDIAQHGLLPHTLCAHRRLDGDLLAVGTESLADEFAAHVVHQAKRE